MRQRRVIDGHEFTETDGVIEPRAGQNFNMVAQAMCNHCRDHPDQELTFNWSGTDIPVRDGDTVTTLAARRDRQDTVRREQAPPPKPPLLMPMTAEPRARRETIGGVHMKQEQGGWTLDGGGGNFDMVSDALVKHKKAHPGEEVKMHWNGRTFDVARDDDAGSLWDKYNADFHKPDPARDEANRRAQEAQRKAADSAHAETSPVIASSKYQFTREMGPVTSQMTATEMDIRRVVAYALDYLDKHREIETYDEAGKRKLSLVLAGKFPESDNPAHVQMGGNVLDYVVNEVAYIKEVGWPAYKAELEQKKRGHGHSHENTN